MISVKSGDAMGSKGSGRRWRLDAKDRIEERLKIDIRVWHRKRLLQSPKSFSWKWLRTGQRLSAIAVHVRSEKIILDYRHQNIKDEWVDKKYWIFIQWTSCNYGGKRPWFICPVNDCRRRVAILYSGSIYACRHCHQLAYTSQREAHYDRGIRKAEKIRERLGWEASIFEMTGFKPKGMHWSTFERLSILQHTLILTSLTKVDLQFGSNFFQEYCLDNHRPQTK